MSRGDGIKDILRLALIMQDSYQGLSKTIILQLKNGD